MGSSYVSRIGVVGTGFISQGLIRHLLKQRDLVLSKVLTRRNIGQLNLPSTRIIATNSLDDLIDHSDLIVECSGDVRHATIVVNEAMNAGLPVVTMNSEFHVTTGSWFVDRGCLSEAEGDQPGCLAALDAELQAMGFEPIVYGNMKRYQNRQPTLKDMRFWSRKQGISLGQVTSFTDGTKVQIEQALVANGLGAEIAQMGLLGVASETFQSGVEQLTKAAIHRGSTISDYVLCPNNPSGVFIVARHDAAERDALEYLKLGSGPYYLLKRDYHLCHLEICKSIRKVLKDKSPLLNNSAVPSFGVAAFPKKILAVDTQISRGIGGGEFFGMACQIEQMTNLVPIGLLDDATIVEKLQPGSPVTWDQVDCPQSLARDAWFAILQRIQDSKSILKFPTQYPAAVKDEPQKKSA